MIGFPVEAEMIVSTAAQEKTISRGAAAKMSLAAAQETT
jgi:hypothetical protein